jgi:CDI immunity proteins
MEGGGRRFIKNYSMKDNLRYATLEQLENDFWKENEYESSLVKRCHALRKVVLNKFSIDDLRVMIGQEIGLKYLVPIALEKLEINLFAEGNYYEGDLLKQLLEINTAFWDENKEHYLSFYALIKDRRSEIVKRKFSLENMDKCKFTKEKH